MKTIHDGRGEFYEEEELIGDNGNVDDSDDDDVVD